MVLLVILSYSFTPIAPHLTSTEKAVGLQAQMDEASKGDCGEAGLR